MAANVPPAAGRDLTGQVAFVTGASGGIGAAAARRLHALGATVHVARRSPERTAAVAAALGSAPSGADFGRLAQVRSAASQVLERCDRLDLLVNNAGLWVSSRLETPDGYELMFGVNYLAPFLLTTLLTDLLIATAPTVYATTKLENILFTRELGRRLTGTGVLATCFHPGVVATDLGRGDLLSGAVYRSPLRRVMKSADQGADTLS